MRGLIVHWLATFVAVLVAGNVLAGYVSYDAKNLAGVAIFAATLALLNTFVKPVLGLLTAPISCLTLGLFVLVINAFLFWLAATLTGNEAVQVNGVAGAFLGSLIVSAVSLVVARITKSR